jgi:ABC-type cobalamin/Fe3+-siderophores transport system ATPase subunit
MGILKENLVELQNTGVVVSHDIGLSLNFADIIVLLTKTKHEDQDIGISLDNYYLERSNGSWNFKDGKKLENPRAFISDLLNN